MFRIFRGTWCLHPQGNSVVLVDEKKGRSGGQSHVTYTTTAPSTWTICHPEDGAITFLRNIQPLHGATTENKASN
jgi:hypothetical protein